MNLSNNILDFFKAFLGGVGISFTPCVYPLIPVIIGIIGIKPEASRIRGFLLSLSYVTGIAITYSLLGLFASLTGQIFGRISSHPVTYLIVSLVIIVFGLSMLGFINLKLRHSLKLPDYKERNILVTFILGLVSGLIIGPCTVPVLGSILLHLATKKDILYGAILLLSFAYGMGTVLILAGTFSNFLLSLPKPGKWLKYVNNIFALILIITGVYFLIIAIRRF